MEIIGLDCMNIIKDYVYRSNFADVIEELTFCTYKDHKNKLYQRVYIKIETKNEKPLYTYFINEDRKIEYEYDEIGDGYIGPTGFVSYTNGDYFWEDRFVIENIENHITGGSDWCFDIVIRGIFDMYIKIIK